MRLFVAVNLPTQVRQLAWQAAAPLRSRGYPVKWVNSEALHFTLKFLGEVEPQRQAAIMQALESAVAGNSRFRVSVGGCGAFPNARRPRVVWIGCEAVAPFELIQHRVEQEMSELGFPVEGRPFRPHLTLGRVKRGARAADLAGFDSALEQVEFQGEVDVESIDLMRSELSRAGARYTVVCAVALEV